MEQSPWRWFPLGLLVALAIVFAVNGYFVYVALASFPGAAGTDGFDLSNGYDRVLSAAEGQAALGWQVDADMDRDHHPVLRVTDRSGAPLAGIAIVAQAERPVGPATRTALPFHAEGGADYISDTALFAGQWDLLVTVNADGKSFTATRRIVVR